MPWRRRPCASRKDPAVSQVVICSLHKDLAQLVSRDRIVCWDRRRNIVYDEAAVLEKYGVAPHTIPDLLALVGDAADGIPGVPSWGVKSAATGALEISPSRSHSCRVGELGGHCSRRPASARKLHDPSGGGFLYRRLTRRPVPTFPSRKGLDAR